MLARAYSRSARIAQPLAGQPFPASARELGTHSAISDGYEMATVSKFCLACGKEIGPNDQRYLCKESAGDVYRVWSALLLERLKDKDMEMDVESVFTAAGHNCTCKNCFKLIERFCDKRIQLLRKLDAVIKKIPNASGISTSGGSSESNDNTHTPSRQVTSRKRRCPCPHPDQRNKFPRISADWHSFAPSSSSASPGVEVDNMNSLCEVATYMQCVKITFSSNH